MRRFISYLLLSAATVVGVGASVVPTIRNMDADLAYADGKTLYFKASGWDESTQNGNYTDGEGSFLTYDESLAKQPIAFIADTFRQRLDLFGVSGYKVETQGADTIAVTLRTAGDSETLYSYLEAYLPFSGGDYWIDATSTSGEGYSADDHWSSIIDGQTATIAEMEQGNYKVPTVVIPIKAGDEYKKAFENLVEYCTNNSTEADEQAGTEAKNCNIVVWANRDAEVDTYEASLSDANMQRKIVSVVNPANAVYYASKADEENKENPYLRLIPSSAATQGESYDPTKTAEAYAAAKSLMLTINAGAFEYEDLKVGATTPKYAVSFTYSEKSPASVESFLVNGDWNQNVAMSATFISVLVGALFLIVLLAVFERALAPLHFANAAITGFSALAVFVAFGAPFNIAALIGLTTGIVGSLFSTLFYSAKLKEELYKGRTLKKAHNEAVRKALLPTLDISVVEILIGVCLYGLAGDVAAKAGIMLVLVGFFGFVAALVFTRVVGWMLCNSSYAASAFPKLLGVKQDRIPDLAKEEKPSYFGPYADRDFSKGKKISLIALCAFVLAGVGASIAWGVNGGKYFNSASYESSAPVLRIDVRSPDSASITNYAEFANALDLDGTFKEGEAPKDIYHFYKVDGKYLADYVSDVSVSATPKTVYYGEGNTGETYYWFYYRVTLGKNKSVFAKQLANDTTELKVQKWNGTAYVDDANATTLSELSLDIIQEYAGGSATETAFGAYVNDVVITFNSVTPETLTPYLWQVALGLGVAAATVLVYLALRYRPSRGIAAGLAVGLSSFVATSFFILTRIATLPAASLGSIMVLVLGVGIALFVLATEKEIFRESKEKEKNNAEFRLACLNAATSRQAANVFLFGLLTLYVAVVFLGFGPRVYATAYIGAIIGLALALALTMTALAPVSGFLGKRFARIQFTRDPSKSRRKKKKAGGQLMKKRSSAEPEESIFIGIND